MRTIDPGKRTRPSIVDPGPAPMLQWIRIEHLVVDDSYQRELKPGNWSAIERIAKKFKWSRFSPVFVAPIEGGRFAIIDGQHRTHAAAICGFAEVPCQVVQMTPDEQAASFAAVNGMVTKVTVWQIFKAALAAGEPWAVEAAAIAEAGGCKLMVQNASNFVKKPGEIYGVSSFRRIVEAFPRSQVIAGLQVLMKAEGYNDAPEIWDMNVLYPLLRALARRPGACAADDIVDQLERYDIWQVIDDIAKSTKERLRKGLPYSPKKDQLEERFGDWLDAKYAVREAAE